MGWNEARMRNTHFLHSGRKMNFLIGFLIAIAAPLTGIGGGSFTVPALLLLAGTWALRILNRDAGSPVVILLLGVLLAASSSVAVIKRVQNTTFAGKIS